jgi:opacity protein-like surface antigen
MKKFAIGVAAALFVAGPAIAEDVKPVESKPVTLTEAQMDSITAAGYGNTIIEVAGVPFGQLIGPAKKNGTAVHSNYAGGAKALVETVCVHLPNTPGC